MAEVKPFKGVRATRDKVGLVASRTFLSYSKRALQQKLDENPYTFLHVIQPNQTIEKKLTPKERFKWVKSAYGDFCKKGILKEDAKAAFYLYAQETKHHKHLGLIAATSVDDYLNNVILKHEQTLTKREEMFKEYLDICGFNAEPVLLFHQTSKELNAIYKKICAQREEYDFSTTDLTRHSLWLIDDKKDIDKISKIFEGMNELFIADGHHRSSSSALLALEKRKKTKKGSFNHFLSILISEDNLVIRDYNRLVKDLGKWSSKILLEKLKDNFEVKKSDKPYKSTKLKEFGMYIEGSWYKISLKESIAKKKGMENAIDAQILYDFILQPLLSIGDPKTDQRLEYVSGVEGMEGLSTKIDQYKTGIAFSLFPVPVKQLKHIARNNLTMPPKSTWIEPKLRSGLIIYNID